MDTIAEPTASSEISKPHRRWFQFSLRTLLIVTVLCSLAFAWYAKTSLRIKNRDELTKQLKANSCVVFTKLQHNSPYIKKPESLSVEQFLIRLCFGKKALDDEVYSLHVYPRSKVFKNSLFRDLPEIRWLRLDEKQCDDETLSDLSKTSPHLLELELYDVKVTAKNLQALPRFKNLKRIYIGRGFADDACMEHFSTMTQLDSLTVGGQKITDTGLKYLSDLHDLQSLNLNFTSIEGSGFKDIKSLPKLIHLRVWESKLNDEGIENIVRIAPTIERLYVSKTKITDRSIEDLLKLKNLKILEIGKTSITSDGAKKLADCKNMQELQVPADISSDIKEQFSKKLPACKLVTFTGN